ncbi:hypothetical protein JVU11DRAFT_9847 [Chiua virens]|nr:hypothetical protein JVU11DRAFT_9847 [Chiua virens]
MLARTSSCPNRSTRWQDELPRYQTLVSDYQFEFIQVPATPEGGSQRYNPKIVRQHAEPLQIPPGQQKFLSALPPLPDGWGRQVHPEGAVLFYHETLRIFTESNVIHHEKDILFCAIALIEQAIRTNGVTLDELTELVLNVDDQRRCHYYFVDHTHRLLFWVDAVCMRDLGTDLQGVSEYGHIRYWIETQYWLHCEYYPHNRILPKGVFQDLRGMLNYAKTDMMTTDSSSSPFAQDELVAILDLVNSLKDDEEIYDPYSVWVVARLMSFFSENQFVNFYGQSSARLNAETPLFGQQTWNRSTLFRVVNLFLLGSPSEHALRVQRIWVDGIIVQPRWKDFISRFTSELGRYTIFSTVMLAVNFSFLSVPGVVNKNSTTSTIQIIIYCSIVPTIASIAFSFALLNVYNDPGLVTAGRAAVAMRSLSQRRTGMPCLAITHSIPIASLIWSIVLFSTALAVQIFRPRELASATTLGVECFIFVAFAVMSIRTMRLFFKRGDEQGEEDEAHTYAEKHVRSIVGSQHDVVQQDSGRWCGSAV